MQKEYISSVLYPRLNHKRATSDGGLQLGGRYPLVQQRNSPHEFENSHDAQSIGSVSQAASSMPD